MIKQPEKTLTSDDSHARREARVDRLALSSLPTLWDQLVDYHGRPMPGVRALNSERSVADFPRLAQLKWLGGGARWADLGSGASGATVTDLVVWLAGGCERSKAVAFLEATLAELDANAA